MSEICREIERVPGGTVHTLICPPLEPLPVDALSFQQSKDIRLLWMAGRMRRRFSTEMLWGEQMVKAGGSAALMVRSD